MALPRLGSCITVRPSTLVSPPFHILVLHHFNPVLEVDRILAYKTKFSLPFGRIIGSESLFSNKYRSFVIVERLI